uniref:Uncharacterized protein n=1 Tax=Anopheles atroparvus TaxID=41427 RepID=A0A182JBF0_ANOAO
MGVMLSVLVASVGAMDLIYCLAFASNQLTDGSQEDGEVKPAASGEDAGLEQYRNSLRQQIDGAQRGASGSGVTYAQDGTPYHDGYRVEQHDEIRLDALMVKLRELERRSQEKDERLEQMSVQMGELERNTLEQTLIIEDLRSRSVSRAGSVEPMSSARGGSMSGAPSALAVRKEQDQLLSVLDVDVPQIVLNAEADTAGGTDDEPRPSSSKFRPIRRDSELRKSVKRRSVTSTASLEDRREELELLSRMEAEEAARVDDEEYTVIEYTRNNDYLGGDVMNRRHNISPINELCQLHEDEDAGGSSWCPERSPEPTLAANITKPWGDIKLDEMKRKEKAVTRLSRSMSIEEEEGARPSDADDPAPVVEVVSQQLHTNELAASNLSSHSNTPEHTNEPATLRRTTKEAHLPGLLQPAEAATEQDNKASRRSVSPWTTEIIVHTETESDSDTGPYGTSRRPHTKFMQSKSPSPYPTTHGQDHPTLDAYSSPTFSSQLVPLLLPSEPYPQRPRSPTPYDEPGSSREPTPTSSSSSQALTKGSVSPRDRTISPQAPDPAIVRGSPVSPAVEEHRSSPHVGLEIDAGTEGDTECDDGGRLRKKRSKSPRSKSSLAEPSGQGPAAVGLSPRLRYKERKRLARSLTPIDYDQTFMDSFTEQHLSVTPSELEDYINSMDEIHFEPPEPVRPSYLYPKANQSTDIPSLVLTDAQGTDAQFHDDLSSKSFYGQSHPHADVTLNHRVSYVEWIRKFPDNQTSHLTLEDFDSDDEEVEAITRKAAPARAISPGTFPTSALSKSGGTTPQPAQPQLVASPEVYPEINGRIEFPLNLTPAYATPSPVSQLSDLSEPSTRSSQPPTSSCSSSLELGSPLFGNTLHGAALSDNHFTPLSPSPSPRELTNDTERNAQCHHTDHPQTPIDTTPNTAPSRTSLRIPGASRTPSLSPRPAVITPEELVFEIGHLDGLIFEARSREPTPQPLLLSPDELAFDIGNLGGLILGPPSRSVSPVPPTSGTSSSSWVVIDPAPDGQTNRTTSTANHNQDTHNNE